MEGNMLKTVVSVDELMQPSHERIVISYERIAVNAPCGMLNGCPRSATHIVKRSGGSFSLCCSGHIKRIIALMRQG